MMPLRYCWSLLLFAIFMPSALAQNPISGWTTNGSSFNTALGVNALQYNFFTTGFDNTALGSNALLYNTFGHNNTATGEEALFYNSEGNNNTATGYSALYNNSGSDNTATGVNALFSNNNGSGNTASGVQALYSNFSGSQNTAIGYYALWSNYTGFSNTAIGNYALRNNTTGQTNTAIGSYADVPWGSKLTNATAIGYGAIVDASNKIRLGNTAVTLVETSGTVSAGGSVSANSDVIAGGNVQAVYRVIAGHGFIGKCMTPFLGSIYNPVICDQFDVAETFPSAEATEPGDVLIVASQPAAATVRKSSRPYDDLLLGVVSTSPGVVLDGSETNVAGDNSKLITPNKTVVGLAGRVPVKVSMENGAIRVGDPLTSSSTPGVAMKATRAGKILGYALESTSMDGKVLLFVQPGYYAAPDLQRLHAENASLRTKMRKLSQDNSELRTAIQRIRIENIQSQRQMQELLQQVKTISRKLDSTTVAQLQP